ncbi:MULTISPECIES: zf-HC2 domain-containing protein [unclassified Streptomyces]|uniref:zf-HC2 domain-containing protein n=1 Tax=unclassified Streptomyces TaxID=2593676 RepID=UPI0011A57430|nr:zf-HC2 domain-containing protein [Streptomyces sp. BK340]TVZ96177.1 hypothetical protein FB157_10384 [Streptomyces sp. BK340]
MATASSTDECRAFRDALAEHALELLPSERAAAVVEHLGICTACRDEYHCHAAVAAHLSSLREALAPRLCPERRSHPPGAVRTTPLTLSQWVDRMAYVR